MSGKNCWEVKNCGREPGGAKASELGVCPAATDKSVNGLNGGKNGGRTCWYIAGTFCGGLVQGSMAQKLSNCMECEFFKQVAREEKADLVESKAVLACMRR
ncbi:MAG: hypothetical protein GY867_01085 [bacterium]|nr:hypothetical protein [bacterium]